MSSILEGETEDVLKKTTGRGDRILDRKSGLHDSN